MGGKKRRRKKRERWIVPVRHVIEVLCELSEIRALLFVLFFCPQQNLWDLQTEVLCVSETLSIHKILLTIL